jgi:hypothetical protein
MIPPRIPVNLVEGMTGQEGGSKKLEVEDKQYARL